MLADHILFLDGEAIIVDKPSGLPVDPPRDGSLSLENHLQALTFGFKRWPTAVHRLDRDTSGCLLLARNPKAHARFQQAFEAKTVVKHYYAVVDGVPEAKSGVIDLPLAKRSTPEEGRPIVVDTKKGKPAVTAWDVVAEQNGRALVRFIPETGRTHQIRVHLASAGHPIVGDDKYGDFELNRQLARLGFKRMFLHAWRLKLTHPVSGQALEMHTELPEELRKWVSVGKPD